MPAPTEELSTVSVTKFYGSSLPRPYLYTDVKFHNERIDPPAPVTDPFLSWAREAHWRMGGLSFERHRMQGKIEGSIKKLRDQKEKEERKLHKQSKRIDNQIANSDDSEEEEDNVPEEVKGAEEEEEEEKIVNVKRPSVAHRRSKRLRKLAEYSESEEI